MPAKMESVKVNSLSAGLNLAGKDGNHQDRALEPKIQTDQNLK